MPPTPFAIMLDLSCTVWEEILIMLYDQGDTCSCDASSLPTYLLKFYRVLSEFQLDSSVIDSEMLYLVTVKILLSSPLDSNLISVGVPTGFLSGFE